MLALQVLYRQGYKVLEASQGKEASLICEGYRGPIHLMVTDVVMPGMNGPELAEKLLSLRREMKILFMSGYTANAVGYHNFFKKRVHYIQKPFTVAGLARKVREVLDEKAPDYIS